MLLFNVDPSTDIKIPMSRVQVIHHQKTTQAINRKENPSKPQTNQRKCNLSSLQPPRTRPPPSPSPEITTVLFPQREMTDFQALLCKSVPTQIEISSFETLVASGTST